MHIRVNPKEAVTVKGFLTNPKSRQEGAIFLLFQHNLSGLTKRPAAANSTGMADKARSHLHPKSGTTSMARPISKTEPRVQNI